jgi:hypothetical protein
LKKNRKSLTWRWKEEHGKLDYKFEEENEKRDVASYQGLNPWLSEYEAGVLVIELTHLVPLVKKCRVETSLWAIAHTATEALSYLATHVATHLSYFQAVVFPPFSEDGYNYKPVVYLQSSWWRVGQICLLQLCVLSGRETSWLSPISKLSFNLTPYMLVTSLRTEFLVSRI